MLTNLSVRDFKRFDAVEIELGSPVVFIGPNNSGKTSAMQALALWDIGLKRWLERHGDKGDRSAKRPGVTVNRRDLVAIPVPSAKQLWRGLHTRNVRKVDGRQRTDNIRIEIVVHGIAAGEAWSCGLEFDYANPESFYCRPLRRDGDGTSARMAVPEAAGAVRVAFLPPMSGLAATETRLQQGAVNVRIGEGRTAEVLRNLCSRIHEEQPDQWTQLVGQIEKLFGARLDAPKYIDERGEITMSYREGGTALDLSSSGRGLQQTLLILAYMYANPGAVLLLDEPDAHLEILRQRQIYQLIADVASDSGSQIVAASHSEVLLNEAAGKDTVIAFVGEPHRIDDRGSQVLKALKEIGFDQYAQAEQTGWMLYLEGSTDLAILQSFARRLGHERAMTALERPFVHYVANQPAKVREHYYGLREALPDLKGLALFDHLDSEILNEPGLIFQTWERREIENYLCSRAMLEGYARSMVGKKAVGPGPLFEADAVRSLLITMNEAIDGIEGAMAALDKGSPWDFDVKVSDEFLIPVFKRYFSNLNLPNLMDKSNFHQLVAHVPAEEIAPEITEKLDAIASTAEEAKPRA